ncbi:HTH-type transcriptional regulator LutR [Moorella thermoacetica]|uniref:HTH-type transcriptional regulator LutR n=1 Tax=Neomoorella thermoacetica TaxID=1525 RepID=A0A1J5JT15_NEOTH|nr:FadR/GntR family transcriptional regulator [Moorella thermoacetica]OIQ07711.1 HTH-type transcriptional regulator LutR [Moorella thermoacetica]
MAEGKFLIRKKKLYEEIVEQITRLIKTGNYKIGDRLPSFQELSEMFGVGKPTLREALSVLASSGVLEIRHGNGTFIKRLPLDPEDIPAQLGEVEGEKLLFWLEYRRAIETEAASLAAERRSEADIAAMEEAEQRLEGEIALGAITVDPDYQFHYCIARATHNPIFAQAYTTIAPMMHEYFQLSLRYGRTLPWHRELVVGEHRDILECIRKGQPREARRAMIKHINNVAGRVRLLESLINGEKATE